MASEIVVAQQEIASPSFHLVARDPQEMACAQSSLTAWLVGKITSIKQELSEVDGAYDVAKKNGWATKTYISQHSRINSRIKFYEKTLEAVNAGFTIVPNFPIDIFAIRVKRNYVKEGTAVDKGNWANPDRLISDEKPDVLNAGEGRYESPSQLLSRETHTEKTKEGADVTVKSATPYDFNKIEFPIVAAHPEVMTAAQQAMALRIFDQIGICPNTQRAKGDPLIIGQIIRKEGWQTKTVSFLIAWHLDLRTL